MSTITESSQLAHSANPPKTSPAKLSALQELAPYLRKHNSTIFFALLSILLASSSILAFGWGLRRIVDDGLGAGTPEHLNSAFMVMLAIILVLAFAGFSRLFLVSKIGEGVVADLRRNVYAHLLKLSPGFYESTRTGEILSRLTADTSLIQTVIGTSVPIAIRNGFSMLGAVALLFFASPKLASMVLMVVPFVVVPIIVWGRKVRRLSRLSQDKIADIGAFLGETLGNIRIIQSFTHEEIDRMHFNERTLAAYNMSLRRSFYRSIMSAMIIGLVFGAIAIVLWIGGYDVIEHRMSGGELAAFVFYAVVVAGSVAAFTEVLGDLQRAAGATERIIELLHTVPTITNPEKAQKFLPPSPGTPAIEFHNVVFSYPSRPLQKSMEEFSLNVARGEHIGIMGASGAGKTTLFQLLLRFYDPQSGYILVDGVPIKNVDLTELRSKFAYVTQDPVIFSATLLENIRYGREDASDDEVKHAMEAAMVGEFVNLLPDGVNSYLGERGVRLSGGQRQRISIARAILRNPEILLLDEATSQLDPENERLVQIALEKLMVGRTTLMIAHRLSTLRDADKLIVLENGRLIQTGKPDEILRNQDFSVTASNLKS